MTSNADVRKAHGLLDALASEMNVKTENVTLLRSLIPALPAQKTLEEIADDVCKAWIAASGDEWVSDGDGSVMSLEDWLSELHIQLKGLKGTPIAVPALPAGMRLADHESYGRVVVSPGVSPDGRYEIFNLDPGMSSGTDLNEVEPDTLTFIDAEPANPAHPEFLETEADYENAPVGTVAIREGGYPWTRIFGSWVAYSRSSYSHSEMAALRGKARVLRWGDGK